MMLEGGVRGRLRAKIPGMRCDGPVTLPGGECVDAANLRKPQLPEGRLNAAAGLRAAPIGISCAHVEYALPAGDHPRMKRFRIGPSMVDSLQLQLLMESVELLLIEGEKTPVQDAVPGIEVGQQNGIVGKINLDTYAGDAPLQVAGRAQVWPTAADSLPAIPSPQGKAGRVGG